MAKVIGQEELSQHGNTIYPWELWGNGEAWEIEAGKDFTIDAQVMRGQVIVRARKLGQKVVTHVVTPGDGRTLIRFQFTPA